MKAMWPALVGIGLSFGLAKSVAQAVLEEATGEEPLQRTIVTPRPQPKSFRELIACEPSRLGALDLARMNLLCAEGLPGAEQMIWGQVEGILNAWAARVRAETDRAWHQFRSAPADFQDSEAYFRMLVMITVLQQDCGVRYRPERIQQPDHRDSRDLFLHGLTGDARAGTCVSMPVLYAAVGRRLGYPLKLVTAKAHVFVRWEGTGERLNIEATGRGLSCFPDEHYRSWPVALSEAEAASGHYLKSLDPAGELAVFLSARGHCLEANGRLPESQVAHALAHSLAPNHPDYAGFLAASVAKELPQWQRIRVDLGEPSAPKHPNPGNARIPE